MDAFAAQQWSKSHSEPCNRQINRLAPVDNPEPPCEHFSELQAALLSGIDRLSHGVALLDVAGRCRYTNAAARTLSSRIDQWADRNGGNWSTVPGWATALQRVCLQGRREMLHVDTPQTSVMAVLTPLKLVSETLAFTVFGRDDLCGSVELQMFALEYQLTNAETSVLRQLTRGLSAKAIAIEHRVCPTTVLTQIAAIRSKTRCVSVRSVLGTLARMPPVRPLQLSAT